MLRDIREGCGVIGGVLVTLAVALRPHHATSSSLFWFAVAMLGVAGLAYVGAVVERFRVGSELSLGLVPKDHQIIGELHEDTGIVDLRVGMNLLNNTAVPLRYQAEVFSVRIGDTTSPLTESPELTLSPHLEKGWFRHPIPVSVDSDLPAPIEVDFRFVYGRVGKRMSRSVEGAIRSRIPKIDAERAYPGFIEEIRPTQDRALPSVRLAYVKRLASGSLTKLSLKR